MKHEPAASRPDCCNSWNCAFSQKRSHTIKAVRDVQSLFANPPIMIFGLWLMLEMKMYIPNNRSTSPCLLDWNAVAAVQSSQTSPEERDSGKNTIKSVHVLRAYIICIVCYGEVDSTNWLLQNNNTDISCKKKKKCFWMFLLFQWYWETMSNL